MSNSEELQQLYTQTSEKTLAKWAMHPGIGRVREEAFYEPHKLAITSGIQPALTPSLTQLLHELHELAHNDPLADVMPYSGLHFTFFAITMPLYQCRDISMLDQQLPTIFSPINLIFTAMLPRKFNWLLLITTGRKFIALAVINQNGNCTFSQLPVIRGRTSASN